MDWDAIYRLMDHAQGLQTEERVPYLRSACGDNEMLLEQVLQILSAEVSEEFLEPPTNLNQGLFGGDLHGRRLGPYLLEREIARGGMGVIYLAQDASLNGKPPEGPLHGEPVVVKVLPQIQRSKPAIFERFQREAQAASKLNHPHALSVLGTGETEGIAWYAMPYVDGHDLHLEILAQKEHDPVCLWPEFGKSSYSAKVVQQVAGIADALHGFHVHGITHRDIKPRNLLLNKQGHLTLADFGLAKIAELESLTDTGAVQGTPYYMSPEQAGAVHSSIDHRTDIYSLCVVLYELLSLKRPFDSESVDVVIRHITSDAHIPLREASPRTPRDLILICEKGMAHQPLDRYDTALELAQDLQRFLNREAILAKPAPFTRRASKFARKHRMPIGIVLFLLAISLAWLGSAQWQAQQNRQEQWRQAFVALSEAEPTLETLRNANLALAAMSNFGEGPTRESRIAQDTLKRDRQARHVQLAQLMELGRGRGILKGRTEDYQRAADQISLVRAHQLAQESVQIYPGDTVFAKGASSTTLLPVITFTLAQTADPGLRGHAWALPHDDITALHGPPVYLGEFPLYEQALSHGEWRFVVMLSDGSFFEYDRVLRPARNEYRIQVLPPKQAPSTEGMVLIQPKNHRFPTIDPRTGAFTKKCCYSPAELPLADYWIDEAVVSNGEYLEYLEDSGASAPPMWDEACLDGTFDGDWHELPTGDMGEAWLELPATAVPCLDAMAFAEFYGKRLAGHYEMEYALRGPELLLAPWGAGAQPDDFLANVHNIPYPTVESTREMLQREYEHLLPVRAPGYRHAPFGLFHAYGNVAQRSWGVPMVPGDGLDTKIMLKHVGDRLIFGTAYGNWVSDFDYSVHRSWGQTRGSRSWGIGFRCVRSAQPSVTLDKR